MGEDIKFIKYYMKQYFYEDISIEDDFKFEEAIKNLLTRYKQLEEENKNKTQKIIEYEKTLEKLQKETIWKSKVKEKIEQLENKKDIEDNQTYNFKEVMEAIIAGLQDLLREE